MVCIFVFHSKGVGQTKYEREYRLNLEDVPPLAIDYVNSITVESKVKWYYEENLLGNSIEAKFRYMDRLYSVEFDTSGLLQDVEIEIEWSEIPEQSRKRMTVGMDSLFTKHKVQKVQIQYSGDQMTVLQKAKGEEPGGSMTTMYEVVISGKKENERNSLYEIHFTEEGEMLDVSRIIFKNSDNLEF
jgi:hypothetical protein